MEPYRGKGNHSVNELERLIEQREEQLHLIKSGQLQSRIEQLEKALKPVKEGIDHIDHADGSNWEDPTWNENYTLNIGLRVSEIRLILQALKG